MLPRHSRRCRGQRADTREACTPTCLPLCSLEVAPHRQKLMRPDAHLEGALHQGFPLANQILTVSYSCSTVGSYSVLSRALGTYVRPFFSQQNTFLEQSSCPFASGAWCSRQGSMLFANNGRMLFALVPLTGLSEDGKATAFPYQGSNGTWICPQDASGCCFNPGALST